MRAAVMAALHFEFGKAQYHGSQSDIALFYNEDFTNMRNFINLLAQLRDLVKEQQSKT